MRGRGGGTSSSAVCREPPSRMSQRRNVMRDGVSSGQHQQDDRDDEEEASSSLLCVSSREKRRRQRENKLRTKDLSEEEMMDLALQLSEKEASVAALRLQREEEEDVMKAIEESMILHNHRPQSPSLLADVEAPNRTCSRRKLSYSNGTSAVDEDETQLISGEKSSVEVRRRQKKQKRKPGSPLLEMPDLSQTQNLDSGSAGGSEVVDLSQDSSQSSDSTLIDDSQPPRSPVFPSTCCRAEVLVPRMSQDLLQSCRSSGFVLCSQDSHMSPKSLPDGAKSPTFPQSPQHSRGPPSQRTLVSSKPDQGHIGDRSPESCGSPGLCRSRGGTSGFTFSSQDSLTSSVVSTSCRSPVFPRTGPPSSEVSQTESGPVFLKTEPPQMSKSLKRNQDSDGAGRRGDQIEDVNDSPGSGVKVAVRADSEEAELSNNMTLHWSDDDDDVTPVASPSPVFPAETGQDADPSEPPGSNCRGHCSNTKPQPISSLKADRGAGHPAACGSTVHYYWGVPFCPRGLDPDRFTQVIVEQMEVYEKSLKEAQRNLLRKAQWGEGIQPQPEEQQENSPSSESPAEASEDLPPQRRLRNRKWGDAVDSPPAGAEEEEKEDGEEVEHRESQKEESRSRVGGGEQMETDDCEVPETQLSEDERTQDVIVVRDVRAERQMKSAELPDVQMILQLESPPAKKKVEEEEVMEVDAPTVRHTEGNSPQGRSPPAGPARSDNEAETQDEQLLSATPPEQEVAVDVQEASVDCPICQGSFPASQIEVHAAYCDGTPVDSHRRREGGDSIPVSVRPRRKRRRGVEATDGEWSPASNTSSRKLEKCFICHLVVPLQDFDRHTELCIRRHNNTSAAKENLLSVLEKTDNRPSDVRPSGSRLQHGDVIDLRNDDDDEEEEEEEGGGMSSIRISNSPIRSFTPISEATDCLIDFQRQHRSKKPGRRRR